MTKELPKIDLGFREDEKGIIHLNNKELFDTVAKKWADAINRTKKTQARNFYDKILELEEKIKRNDKDNFGSVYPFIKMLNSRVAYGVSRRVVSKEFQEMMNICLEQIKDDEKGEKTFKHFKLFFEAVLGFFKGSN